MPSSNAIRSSVPVAWRVAFALAATFVVAGAAHAQASTTSKDVPIPDKAPAPVSKDSAPQVNIRATDNGDLVEEYSQNGKVYMVHVTPKVGVPYYLYDDDRNGRLDRTDADGKLSPVYYKIYEWD